MNEIKELLKAKSEFRKKGVTLFADKQKAGGGGSWKFAGEDNLIKTIQKPLIECGLEAIATSKFLAENSVTLARVTLYHIASGQSIYTEMPMASIVPKKDKNGNSMYLDGAIEKGKQFGYFTRILTIRLLGLSDIDPEDSMNIPQDIGKKDELLVILKQKMIDNKIEEKEILGLIKGVNSLEEFEVSSINYALEFIQNKSNPIIIEVISNKEAKQLEIDIKESNSNLAGLLKFAGEVEKISDIETKYLDKIYGFIEQKKAKQNESNNNN